MCTSVNVFMLRQDTPSPKRKRVVGKCSPAQDFSLAAATTVPSEQSLLREAMQQNPMKPAELRKLSRKVPAYRKKNVGKRPAAAVKEPAAVKQSRTKQGPVVGGGAGGGA